MRAPPLGGLGQELGEGKGLGSISGTTYVPLRISGGSLEMLLGFPIITFSSCPLELLITSEALIPKT